MRKSFFFIICLFLFAIQLNAQQPFICTLKFNLTSLNLSNIKINIERFQPDSSKNYRVFKIITPSKNLFKYKLLLTEPFIGVIKMKIGDSLIASSGGCIFSDELMNVKLDDGFLKISNKQTTFYQENANLYLDVPSLLSKSNGYSLEKIKRSYKIELPFNENKLLQLHNEYERNILKQVNENKKYFNTITTLYNIRSYISNFTLDSCLKILKKNYFGSEYYNKLYNYVAQAKKIQIGKQLPYFHADDKDGNRIYFENIYKDSEFTLIDFWASWCAPCRAEMQKIKSNIIPLDSIKIKVVSISIDTDVAKWKTANKADNVTWPSFVDTLGLNGNVAKSFNITMIPSNFLVNKKGEIVRINISTDELKLFLNRKN